MQGKYLNSCTLVFLPCIQSFWDHKKLSGRYSDSPLTTCLHRSTESSIIYTHHPKQYMLQLQNLQRYISTIHSSQFSLEFRLGVEHARILLHISSITAAELFCPKNSSLSTNLYCFHSFASIFGGQGEPVVLRGNSGGAEKWDRASGMQSAVPGF